jgi:hypothetical protein
MMRAVVLWWQRALCALRPIHTALFLCSFPASFLFDSFSVWRSVFMRMDACALLNANDGDARRSSAFLSERQLWLVLARSSLCVSSPPSCHSPPSPLPGPSLLQPLRAQGYLVCSPCVRSFGVKLRACAASKFQQLQGASAAFSVYLWPRGKALAGAPPFP